MNYSVYLAGPITGQTLEGAKDWRAIAREYLAAFGVHTYDPLRGKAYLNSIIGENGTYGDQYDTVHPMSSGHGITHRDRWDVRRADLVFVNLVPAPEKVSIGTVMEIAWADAAGVYTLVAMEEANIHRHGMLENTASLVIPSFEDALKLVPTILGIEGEGTP